jgi:predicted Zn-dependent protease
MSTTCCNARAVPAALISAWLLVATGCATPVLSVEDEEKLGDQVAKDARRELDFVRDDLVRKYIEDLGRRIVAAAGPQPFEYRFYVVEDEELNAFAAPGGHVYVQTGLIMAADNLSELAAVMGHEVGHVALRHVARNYYRQRGTGILYQIGAAALAILVGGPIAAGGQLAGQLAAVAYLNTFSRDAEREADQFAVDVLPRVGIHPIGLATFFETLSKQGGGSPPAFLSSHPAPQERIENAREAIAAADLPGTLAIEDDGKLEIIQRRIELLTGQ